MRPDDKAEPEDVVDAEFWHPFLVPVSELILAHADLDVEDEAGLLRLEEMRVSLPLELAERVDADGRVALAISPPTQRIETTFMPTLHRLTLRWTVE